MRIDFSERGFHTLIASPHLPSLAEADPLGAEKTQLRLPIPYLFKCCWSLQKARQRTWL